MHHQGAPEEWRVITLSTPRMIWPPFYRFKYPPSPPAPSRRHPPSPCLLDPLHLPNCCQGLLLGQLAGLGRQTQAVAADPHCTTGHDDHMMA